MTGVDNPPSLSRRARAAAVMLLSTGWRRQRGDFAWKENNKQRTTTNNDHLGWRKVEGTFSMKRAEADDRR